VVRDGTPEVDAYQELLCTAERALDGVDRALAQLSEGTYGMCAACGAPIDAEHLEADPTWSVCSACVGPDAPLNAPLIA